MTSQLSANPSLEQLRKQAKDVLKAHKNGDTSCCAVLKNLHQFKGRTDTEILSVDVSLVEVQFALAMEYGFESWTGMKKEVGGRGTSHITREGNRIRIEGLPEVQLGERWDMLLRSLEYLLRQRGASVTLNELMVYSGDAFSLCHANYWQDMAYLMIPTDTLTNVTSTLGYNSHWLWSNLQGMNQEQVLSETKKALEEIWSEIDRGRPVMVGGCADQGCVSWSIVVGYDREAFKQCHIGIGKPYRWTGIRGISFPCNEEEGLTDHWNGRKRAQLAGHIGGWRANLGFILESKKTAPAEREKLAHILALAIKLFKAEKALGHFYFGEEAYRHWAKQLGELNYPEDLHVERPDGYEWGLYNMGGMDYAVDLVVRGRTAAAAFFERYAPEVAEVGEHLGKAAGLYREQVEIAKEAFDVFVPQPSWSGNGEVVEQWLSNRANCQKGAQAISRMLEKEKAAIGEIEKALAAIE